MSLQEDESVDNARWDHLSKSLIDLCDSIPVREACDEMVKRTLALVNEGQAKHGGDSKASDAVDENYEERIHIFDSYSLSLVKRGISRISARRKADDSSSSPSSSSRGSASTNTFAIFYPMIESIAPHDSVLSRALYSLCSAGGANVRRRSSGGGGSTEADLVNFLSYLGNNSDLRIQLLLLRYILHTIESGIDYQLGLTIPGEIVDKMVRNTRPGISLSTEYLARVLDLEKGIEKMSSIPFNPCTLIMEGNMELSEGAYPRSLLIESMPACRGIITGVHYNVPALKYMEVKVVDGKFPIMGFVSKNVMNAMTVSSLSSSDTVVHLYFDGALIVVGNGNESSPSCTSETEEISKKFNEDLLEIDEIAYMLSLQDLKMYVWIDRKQAATLDISSIPYEILEGMVPFFDLHDCKIEVNFNNSPAPSSVYHGMAVDTLLESMKPTEIQSSYLYMESTGHVLFKRFVPISHFDSCFTLDMTLMTGWESREDDTLFSLLSYKGILAENGDDNESDGSRGDVGFSVFITASNAIVLVIKQTLFVETQKNFFSSKCWVRLSISYSKVLNILKFFVDGVEKYSFSTADSNIPAFSKHMKYSLSIGHSQRNAVSATQFDSDNYNVRSWWGAVSSVSIIQDFRDSTTLCNPLRDKDLHIPLDEEDCSVTFIRSKYLKPCKTNRHSEGEKGKQRYDKVSHADGHGIFIGKVDWKTCRSGHEIADQLQKFDEADVSMQSEYSSDVTLLEFLRKYISNLITRTNNYQEIQSPNLRNLILPEESRFIGPHVLNFLLIRSGIRQAMQIMNANNSIYCDFVCDINECLLNILKANFLYMSDNNILASSVGLKYAVHEEALSRSFVRNLFSSVFQYIVEDNDELVERFPRLMDSAVNAFMYGFEIFLPTVIDRAHALEILLFKMLQSLEISVSESLVLPKDVQSILDLYWSVHQSKEGDCIFYHISKTSKRVLPMLLRAVLNYFSSVPRLVSLFSLDSISRVSKSQREVSSSSDTDSIFSLLLIGDTVLLNSEWKLLSDNSSSNAINDVSRGTVVDITNWGPHENACVHVQWEDGSINCYRWGVEGTDAHGVKCTYYDVSPEADLYEPPYEQSTVNSFEPVTKHQLLYSPEEVQSSLVEDIGELMKRDVLRYMKQISPHEWQIQHKLNWSEKTLVKKLSGEEISAIYMNFYETFGSGNRSDRPFGCVQGAAGNNRGTIFLSFQHNKSLKVIFCQLLALCMHDQDKKYVELAKPILMALQNISLGLFDEPSLMNNQLTPPAPFHHVMKTKMELFCSKVAWDMSLRNFGPSESKQTDQLEGVRPDTLSAATSNRAVPKRIRSRKHPHDLSETSEARNVSARCDLCGGRGNCRYHCLNCDWDICETCFKAESEPFMVTWSSEKKSSHLHALDPRSMIKTSSSSWALCLGSEKIPPYTGIYEWEISFGKYDGDKPEAARPFFTFGVCTDDMRTDQFVGCNQYSWGLAGSGISYHHGKAISQLFPSTINQEEFVKVILDTNEGVLNFQRVDGDIHKAFENLKGKTLYPAASLFLLNQVVNLQTPSAKSSNEVKPLPFVQPQCKLQSSFMISYMCNLSNLCIKTLATCHPFDEFSLQAWSILMASLSSIPMTNMPIFKENTLFDVCIKTFEVALAYNDELNKEGILETKNEVSDTISSMLMNTAILLGRLAVFQISSHSTCIDNKIYYKEALDSIRLGEIHRSKLDFNVQPLNSLMECLNEKKIFPLISNGLKDWDEVGDNTVQIMYAFESSIGDLPTRIIEWLIQHDSTTSHVRQLGGVIIFQLVRSLFVNILYHTGYISELLKVYKAFEFNIEVASAAKPPLVLSYAWNISESFRSWVSREKQLQGLAYETLTQLYFKRFHFLLGVASNEERSVPYSDDMVEIEESQQFKLKATLNGVKDKILCFVQDTTPLFMYRVAMKIGVERATRRMHGFKVLNSFTRLCLDNNYWMIKYIATSQIPLEIRKIPTQSLLQEPCLCDVNTRLSCRVQFESFYQLLIDELVEHCSKGNTAYVVHILNCWGLRISERDHDFISRIDVFYALQDVVEAALGDSFASEECNNLVLRAVMKLLFILAEQVASATDQAPAHLPDSPPRLIRSRSGPETLSDVVFDILYTQIEIIVDVGYTPSKDSLVFLSETLHLIGKLCRNVSCQKMLLKPRWLVLLIRICFDYNEGFSSQALDILSNLLPLADLARGNNKGSELNDFIEEYKNRNTGMDLTDTVDPKRVLCDVFLTICDRLTLPYLGIFLNELPNTLGKDQFDNKSRAKLMRSAIFLVRNLLSTKNWAAAMTDTMKSYLSKGCLPPSDGRFDVMAGKVVTTLHIITLPPELLTNEDLSTLVVKPITFSADILKVVLSVFDLLVVEAEQNEGEASVSVECKEDSKEESEQEPINCMTPLRRDIYQLLLVALCRVFVHFATDEFSSGSEFFSIVIENKFSPQVDVSRILSRLLNLSSKTVEKGNISDIPVLEEYLSLIISTRADKRRIPTLSVKSNESSSLAIEPIYNRVGSQMRLGTDESNKDKYFCDRDDCGPSIQCNDCFGFGLVPICSRGHSMPFTPWESGGREDPYAFGWTCDMCSRDATTQSEEWRSGRFCCKICCSDCCVDCVSAWKEKDPPNAEEMEEIQNVDQNEGEMYGALIENLEQMGFPRVWCKLALEMSNGDLDDALGYILSEGDTLEQMAALSGNRGADEAQNGENIESTTEGRHHSDPINEENPQQYYYDGNCSKIIPVYSEPDYDSEKIGSIIPGEEIMVVDIIQMRENSRKCWLKAKLPEYEMDEDDDEDEADDNMYMEEQVWGWIPSHIRNRPVMKKGHSLGQMRELDDPAADMYQNNSRYRVVGDSIHVMDDVEGDVHDNNTKLYCGQIVEACEESIDCDGKLKLHIHKPIRGWICKNKDIVKHDSADNDDNFFPEVLPNGESGELELLVTIEDNMEVEGTSSERRIRSDPESKWQQLKANNYDAMDTDEDVFSRVTGCDSRAELVTKLQGYSEETLSRMITTDALNINVLYARKAFLAILLIMVRERKNLKTNPNDHLSKFLLSKLDDGSPLVDRIFTFLQLVVFKGKPFSKFDMHDLVFDEIDRAYAKSKTLSLESIMGDILFNMITLNNYDDSKILHKTIFDNLMRHIRLSCSSPYADFAWHQADYTQADSWVSSRPNIHFAAWMSSIFLRVPDMSVVVDLCEVWTICLRGQSVSLKIIAFKVLNKCLNIMRKSVGKESAYKNYTTKDIIGCIQKIPYDRLKRMLSRRIWSDNEDYPIYSAFTKSLLDFVSEVEIAIECFHDEKSIEEDVVTMDIDSKDKTDLQALNRYPVLSLTPQSCVKLECGRDFSGSWTMELWLYRSTSENNSRKSQVGGVLSRSSSAVNENKIASEYIVTSNTTYVKLQSGGLLHTGIDDCLQETDNVCEKALSLSVGQRGSVEHVFNYVVPVDCWTHIALIFDTFSHTLSLLINGDLKEIASFKTSISISHLGSARGDSFTGYIAEFRLWSISRCLSQIKSDMHKNVINVKGLTAYMSCKKTKDSPPVLVDEIGYVRRSKLINTTIVDMDGPVRNSPSCPKYMLQDPEITMDIFNSPIGCSAGLIEFTGTLTRNFEGVRPWSDSSRKTKEVIVVGIRIDESNPTTKKHPLDGYIEWSERLVRTSLTGTYDSIDKSIEFNVTRSSVVQGSPDKMKWLHGLSFKGAYDKKKLQGEFMFSYISWKEMALVAGAVVFDRQLLPDQIYCDQEMKAAHLLTSSRDPAILPIRYGKFKKFEDLPEMEGVINQKNFHEYLQKQKIAESTTIREDCKDYMWFDIYINRIENQIVVGVAFTSELSNTDRISDLLKDQREVWSYHSNGSISCPNDRNSFARFSDDDMISIEINVKNRTISFYKNYTCVHTIEKVVQLKGSDVDITPFVGMYSSQDSVALRDVIDKPVVIKYTENDFFGRSEVCGRRKNGILNGYGITRFHNSNGYWFCHFVNGVRHGIQVWVEVETEKFPVIFKPKAFLFKNGMCCSSLDIDIDALDNFDDECIVEFREALAESMKRILETNTPMFDIQSSTAPFILEVTYSGGATVRSGIEIDHSPIVGLIECGRVVEAYYRSVTHDGIVRFKIKEGWISERHRGGSAEVVFRILRSNFNPPLVFKVVRDDGAKIREDVDLESAEVGICPVGTLISVDEERLINTTSGFTKRVRIITPEWKGWVSNKEKLLEQERVIGADVEFQELKRRALVRLNRQLQQPNVMKLAEQLPVDHQIVQATGTFDVSADTLFLLKHSNSKSGYVISDDFLSVSCDGKGSGSRPMCIGSREFSRGVHYWEVKVESAAWGSVFIGVCPPEATNWMGYGFLNYRATQNHGSEQLYGAYFAVNDTVGVLLDMDHGTVSFFKDGEDFNTGKRVVIDMGVAYHNLRRNSRSGYPVFVPCFGVKHTGDRLTLRKNHWISRKGLGPDMVMQQVLESKCLLKKWRESYLATNSLSKSLLKKLYRGYKKWIKNDYAYILSRPGVEVAICTAQRSIDENFLDNENSFQLRVGSKLSTRYGTCRIIGARDGEIWYSIENSDCPNWYWTPSELTDMLNFDMIQLINEETTGGDSGGSDDLIRSILRTTSLSSEDKDHQTLTYEEFEQLISERQWGNGDDEELVNKINILSGELNMEPTRLPRILIEELRSKTNFLSDLTPEEFYARYVVLSVLNNAAVQVLPFLQFSRNSKSLLKSMYDSHVLSAYYMDNEFDPNHVSDDMNLFHSLKRVVFTKLKVNLWRTYLAETTTFTNPPGDEYERPDEIREIHLNMPVALDARQRKNSLSFEDRLEKSIFGQLLGAFRSMDNRSLRRSYVHMQDAGQRRSFFVKFTEGVDDHGGPYRAAFETALGEESLELMDLFVPCDNALGNIGENKDQVVMNSSIAEKYSQSGLYNHLGKLAGIACRHNILVALSLPRLIWKPLSGELLTNHDLSAVSFNSTKSLLDTAMTMKYLALSAEEQSKFSVNHPELYDEISKYHLSNLDDVIDLVCQAISEFPSLKYLIPFLHNTKDNDQMIKDGEDSKVNANKSPPLSVDVVVRLCDLLLYMRLVSHESVLNEFYDGLSAILPVDLFPMFTASELDMLFCGQPTLDIGTLKRATIYEDVSPNDPHIVRFWEAIELMTPSDQSKLINFCSGRTRLPSSASEFPINFKLTAPLREYENPDEVLPHSQTCFFSLSLPKYTSTDITLERLKYAISNAELMDADFMVRNAAGWENIQG